jgi:hypothetical protein
MDIEIPAAQRHHIEVAQPVQDGVPVLWERP